MALLCAADRESIEATVTARLGDGRPHRSRR
jgi:hypothetical protein